MAIRGYSYVYPRIVEILKGIRGPASGYWNDLEDRVFERLIRPEDADFAIQFPYLCVPLVQAAPAYVTDETDIIESRRQSVFGFVEEETRGYDAPGNVACLRLAEDVVRALIADPKLGGVAANGTEVDDSRLVSGGDEIGGVIPGDTWAEFERVLEIDIRFSAVDLGPSATT